MPSTEDGKMEKRKAAVTAEARQVFPKVGFFLKIKRRRIRTKANGFAQKQDGRGENWKPGEYYLYNIIRK